MTFPLTTSISNLQAYKTEGAHSFKDMKDPFLKSSFSRAFRNCAPKTKFSDKLFDILYGIEYSSRRQDTIVPGPRSQSKKPSALADKSVLLSLDKAIQVIDLARESGVSIEQLQSCLEGLKADVEIRKAVSICQGCLESMCENNTELQKAALDTVLKQFSLTVEELIPHLERLELRPPVGWGSSVEQKQACSVPVAKKTTETEKVSLRDIEENSDDSEATESLGSTTVSDMQSGDKVSSSEEESEDSIFEYKKYGDRSEGLIRKEKESVDTSLKKCALESSFEIDFEFMDQLEGLRSICDSDTQVADAMLNLAWGKGKSLGELAVYVTLSDGDDVYELVTNAAKVESMINEASIDSGNARALEEFESQLQEWLDSKEKECESGSDALERVNFSRARLEQFIINAKSWRDRQYKELVIMSLNSPKMFVTDVVKSMLNEVESKIGEQKRHYEKYIKSGRWAI